MMAFRPACFLTFHTVAIYSAKERYDTWLKSQEEFNDSFMVQVLHGLNIDRFTCLHTHSSQFPEIHIWNTHIYTHILHIFSCFCIFHFLFFKKNKKKTKTIQGQGSTLRIMGEFVGTVTGIYPAFLNTKKTSCVNGPLLCWASAVLSCLVTIW